MGKKKKKETNCFLPFFFLLLYSAATTYGGGRCKRGGQWIWSERKGFQFSDAICLSCAAYAAKSSRKDVNQLLRSKALWRQLLNKKSSILAILESYVSHLLIMSMLECVCNKMSEHGVVRVVYQCVFPPWAIVHDVVCLLSTLYVLTFNYSEWHVAIYVRKVNFHSYIYIYLYKVYQPNNYYLSFWWSKRKTNWKIWKHVICTTMLDTFRDTMRVWVENRWKSLTRKISLCLIHYVSWVPLDVFICRCSNNSA